MRDLANAYDSLLKNDLAGVSQIILENGIARNSDVLKNTLQNQADAAVLELKKYEALVSMSNGKASKIIVPTDAVDMTKSNVVFSETSGLGDVTPSATEEKATKKKDVCCD